MKLDPEIEYNAWHKPSKQIIFNISANTTSLSLSDIPIHAKEIKAHIYLHCGTHYNYRRVNWYFTTLYDAAKIQIYLYNQQAIMFTNEIITLQLDGRGIIDVQRNLDYPENCAFSFEIILYR